jgi:hypothetical protein
MRTKPDIHTGIDGITGKSSDYSGQHSNELLEDDYKLNGRLVPYIYTV